MPQDEIEINPQSNQEMTPDEAAAALAFATKLSEGLLPQAQPESPQGQETGSPQAQTPESGKMAQEMETKMEELKKEVKEMIKEEVSGIKDAIQEALKEGE